MENTYNQYRFRFSGKGAEYFRIWSINILLTIVTFGIYSAWAKVRRKRYFYGCTTLDGSSFEYLADPKKILLGRVIVYGLYAAGAALANVSPLLGGGLIIAVLFVMPYIINKSLKFNAVNSCYRNVRFDFSSSYWKTFNVFILLGILSALTLGLLFPYYMYRIKKHVVENSRYGLQHFSFNGNAGMFYTFYVMAAVLGGGLALLGVGLSMTVSFLAVFIWIAAFSIVMAYVYVSQTNYVLDCMRLRDISFRSTMRTTDYMIINFTNYLAIIFTLGMLAPWAMVRSARYRLENISIQTTGDLNSFVGIQVNQVGALGEEFSDIFDVELGL